MIITAIEVGVIYGIIALGVLISFKIINFSDLTCDGSVVLGSAITATTGSLSLAFLGGALAGVFTALLNTRAKISPLLSGILTAFMLYSVNLRIMGNIPNIMLNTSTPPFLLIALALIIGMILLLNTRFGLALRCIGSNPQFAPLVGINTPFMTITGLALSNGLIALGGGIFSQYQGFADINSGTGTLVTSLAAIMIGEKLFRSKAIILSCFAGSIIYRLIVTGALYSDTLGLQTQDLNLITGILVIAIMLTRRSSC